MKFHVTQKFVEEKNYGIEEVKQLQYKQ